MRRRVESAVKEDEVKGILTISAEGYAAAYEYLDDNGLLCTRQRNINNSDCVLLATFDATDETLQVRRLLSMAHGCTRGVQGIEDGHVSFAMDNQHTCRAL